MIAAWALGLLPPIRRPSGFLPLAMSAIALGMVLAHAAIYGIVHESDEGTPAHIFQLLMVAQLPIAAYFAVTGVPRAPRQTLWVLSMQAGAGLAAIAAVLVLT